MESPHKTEQIPPCDHQHYPLTPLPGKPVKKKMGTWAILFWFFLAMLSLGYLSFNRVPETNISAQNEQYASIDFPAYDKYFSNEEITDLQKETIFDEDYKGRLVLWKGKIESVQKATFGDDVVVLVKHMQNTVLYDVQLYLQPSETAKALTFSNGQTITYTGRLKSWGSLMPHSVEDGKIL